MLRHLRGGWLRKMGLALLALVGLIFGMCQMSDTDGDRCGYVAQHGHVLEVRSGCSWSRGRRVELEL